MTVGHDCSFATRPRARVEHTTRAVPLYHSGIFTEETEARKREARDQAENPPAGSRFRKRSTPTIRVSGASRGSSASATLRSAQASPFSLPTRRSYQRTAPLSVAGNKGDPLSRWRNTSLLLPFKQSRMKRLRPTADQSGPIGGVRVTEGYRATRIFIPDIRDIRRIILAEFLRTPIRNRNSSPALGFSANSNFKLQTFRHQIIPF